jgi:hypothetical protein
MFVTNLENGTNVKEYAESLGFQCKSEEFKSKILDANRKNIDFSRFMSCGYYYGFFGEQIAIYAYMDDDWNLLNLETANLYSEY